MKNNSLSKIENIFIKILSLFIAIALWLFISYTINPDTTIKFRNLDISYILPNDGSVLILGDYPKELDVELYGKRNDLISLSKNDIKVEVDLRYSVPKDSEFKLSVKLPDDDKYTIVNQEFDTVELKLDEYLVKNFQIESDISDVNLKDDYYLKVRTSPISVSVQGAKSEIDKISRLYVEYDAKEFKEMNKEDEWHNISDFRVQRPLKIEYEKEPNREISLDLSQDKVSLICELMQEKNVNLVQKKVDLKVDYFEVVSQTITKPDVKIRGLAKDLEDLEKVVATAQIDDEIIESGKYTFPVKLSLPKNVELLDKKDIFIEIEIKEKSSED